MQEYIKIKVYSGECIYKLSIYKLSFYKITS